MIIYLHGFDATSPGNHEKVLQLQFIDPDVRLISYSTPAIPVTIMQHLLKEVDKMQQLTDDDRPLICGVGLGGFWAERIGFLCDMRQDDALDANRSATLLSQFYEIIWDEQEGYKFKNISRHLQRMQAFKALW